MNETEPQEASKEVPATEAPTGDDSQAKKEQEAIAGEFYEQDSKKQEHTRLQRFALVAHWCIIALIILGVLIVGSMAVTWVLHLILPIDKRWLSAEEIDHIQALLFSGALSAAITLMGRKVL